MRLQKRLANLLISSYITSLLCRCKLALINHDEDVSSRNNTTVTLSPRLMVSRVNAVLQILQIPVHEHPDDKNVSDCRIGNAKNACCMVV